MYPLSYPCDGRRACGIKLSPSVQPISTAPGAINHVLGRRSQPSTKETGTRGTDGWQRWWVVPHGVSLSRVVLRTIVGLSTQRVFGMTKVTQKDEMAGLPSPSQAIPAVLVGRRGPLRHAFEEGRQGSRACTCWWFLDWEGKCWREDIRG